MEPTERDHLTRRLNSLGNQPIDPDTSYRHRSLMASVPVAPSRSRLRPLMVGSLLAGSLFGGVGLAAAGPGLPGSASDVARNVLATVTLGAVDRPDDARDAKAAKQAKAADSEGAAHSGNGSAEAQDRSEGGNGVARSREDCPPGFSGNHGQYVRGQDYPPSPDGKGRRDAARSDCGKPEPANGSGRPAQDGDGGQRPDKATDRGGAGDHRQGSGPPAESTERGQSGQGNAGNAGNAGNRAGQPGQPGQPGSGQQGAPGAGNSADRGPAAKR